MTVPRCRDCGNGVPGEADAPYPIGYLASPRLADERCLASGFTSGHRAGCSMLRTVDDAPPAADRMPTRRHHPAANAADAPLARGKPQLRFRMRITDGSVIAV